MFKSIRHGDNVLQYAILPQDEEGATSSAGVEGPRGPKTGASSRRRSSERRPRRKSVSTWIIVVILVCCVVTAAVLVPVLLSANGAQFPPTKKYQTFAVAASSLKQHGGRYNIHGTQYIVVPVEQIEGADGLLEQLDSKLNHDHETAPSPRIQKHEVPAPSTQTPTTRSTPMVNITHPSTYPSTHP